MKKIDKIIIGVGGAIIATVGASLGVLIYKQNLIEDSVLYGVQIDSSRYYNNRFFNYVGDRRNPSDIQSLINMILMHNNNPQLVADFGTIELVGVTETSEIKKISHYKVEVTKYNDEGMISQITITEVP